VGVKRYWRIYGGVKGLARSALLWLACVLALLGYTDRWAELILKVSPFLLGSTLAGYVVIVCLSDRKPLSLLVPVKSRTSPEDSVFMDLNAKFIHFVSVQTIALLYATAFSSSPVSGLIALLLSGVGLSFNPLSFLGCWLLYYSFLTAPAAALAVFAVADVFDATSGRERRGPDPEPPAPH
jgi:hypothetical protein